MLNSRGTRHLLREENFSDKCMQNSYNKPLSFFLHQISLKRHIFGGMGGGGKQVVLGPKQMGQRLKLPKKKKNFAQIIHNNARTFCKQKIL